MLAGRETFEEIAQLSVPSVNHEVEGPLESFELNVLDQIRVQHFL